MSYNHHKSKLPVIFSGVTHNQIQELMDSTDANRSDVARAAMLAGLEQLQFALEESGMLNLKGWIAALNGKVK